MPWKRLIMNEPPTEATMNHLEGEGWSKIEVVGPTLGKADNEEKPRPVFLVYMWRSIVLAAGTGRGSVRRLN